MRSSGSTTTIIPRGLLLRFRLVFSKNWFDTATRSELTRNTCDRWVRFGHPSAETVASIDGISPSKQRAMSLRAIVMQTHPALVRHDDRATGRTRTQP